MKWKGNDDEDEVLKDERVENEKKSNEYEASEEKEESYMWLKREFIW